MIVVVRHFVGGYRWAAY